MKLDKNKLYEKYKKFLLFNNVIKLSNQLFLKAIAAKKNFKSKHFCFDLKNCK